MTNLTYGSVIMANGRIYGKRVMANAIKPLNKPIFKKLIFFNVSIAKIYFIIHYFTV